MQAYIKTLCGIYKSATYLMLRYDQVLEERLNGVNIYKDKVENLGSYKL